MKYLFGSVRIFLSFVLVFMFVASPLAYAQSSAIDQKLSETKAGVDKLLEVKDSTVLSQDEKAKQEIELKTSLLLNILDLSLAQLNDLSDKIDHVSFPDTDDWKSIQTSYQQRLADAIAYYKDLQKWVLETKKPMTTQEIALGGKKIADQQSAVVNSLVREVNIILSAFNIDDIISLADIRLEKVGSDVDKIYSNNLTKNQKLKTLFDSAVGLVGDAHEQSDKAKEIILHLYDPLTSTSTQVFINNLGTSLNTSTSTLSGAQTRTLIESHIQDLIFGALDAVKSAYTIFLDMSTNAKQYLK